MLRLVSVAGITLAMVIGFVALSSQMRDDFDVRTKVVNGIEDMKAVALHELRCDAIESESPVSEQDSDQQPADNAMEDDASADSDILHQSSGIFSSLDFDYINDDILEVSAVFNNVKGGSGKLRIKSGRTMTLHCSCEEQNLSCQIVASDINRKYVPSKITQ